MKFETINNQLCRMVGPEPLTPEAQFPCVVRLIQDETMLGKANIRACHPETLASKRICSELTDDGLFMDGNYTYRYEIIGYPVADGSAEWALYHVLHKERRALTGYVNDVLVHIQNTEHGIGLYYSGKIMPFDFITPEQFIEGAAHTGWQLYEPEPEPKYAVGDWVEIRLNSGKVVQREIRFYCENTKEFQTNDDGTNFFNAKGDYFISNNSPDDSDSDIDLIGRVIRKLDPSEVVVHIGRLSGTVAQCGDKEEEVFALRTKNNAAIIPVAMLDTATRELVESLLKAQEDK